VTASSKPLQVFRFGVFELYVRARELRRQGVRIRLQEQPFLVLARLLERAGDVVTRDELRQELWPSSVYVDFDHGLNNAIARVREVLGDSAATPRFIETLPRLGYRFIYPVERPAEAAGGATNDLAAAADPQPVAPPPSPAAKSLRLPRSAAAAVALALLLGALGGLWLANRPTEVAARATAAPKEPSVAVLPFVNLSSDPENGFVADGLSEELIHMLAGIGGLKVAARTASFAFRDTQESPAAIARKLNVTHLLEGSVRRSEKRLRVTAQLIDAASGHHLWSEAFDRNPTDILEIQEEIARAAAAALQVKLVAADQQHLSKRLTSDAEAYRQYLIARAQISWVFGRVDWAAVKRSFEAAIARDPQFAAAHAGLAHYYFNRAANDEEERLGQVAAERAFALDPNLSEALSARANWDLRRYEFEGDYEAYRRAVHGYRRALEIDPANGQAAFHFARAVRWADPDLALRMFARTVELDPMRISAVAWGELLRSRDGDESARQRLIDLYNRSPDKKFQIAIFLANLEESVGRLDEAVGYLLEAQARGDVGEKGLWALYMSLGDRAAAHALVKRGAFGELGDAVRLSMEGRYEEALTSLERRRAASPSDHELDVPLARLGLITGNAGRARAVLEQRLPYIVSGMEPIDGRNVEPALDLAAAWLRTGRELAGRELLDRSVAFLDGPSTRERPTTIFLRARAHALAGELDLAQQALDRAYTHGFRSTWGGLGGVERSFEYIDPVESDPAFTALRKTAAYESWLARIRADNARQLARLRTRQPTDPARVAAVEGRG